MENRINLGVQEVLFREGEPADKVFIIKRGEVLCLKQSKDRLVPIFLARAEDLIGEESMIKDATYSYSAISMTTLELIQVPSENFENAMKEAPGWLSDLTITMVNRFQNTANLIADNRVMSPKIISEEDFPSSLEIVFKKLLS